MPAPDPTVSADDVEPSPALSQLGRKWPVTGRKIALIVDAETPGAPVARIKEAVLAAGMLPFVVAPHGGKLGGEVVIDRTFLTAASIEFDSMLVLDAPAPGPDAMPSFDAKAGQEAFGVVDPRVVKLAAEMFRHAKAIGAAEDAVAVLAAAGVPDDSPGVVLGDAESVLLQLQELLENHRVWERFPA